jgi:hypothetical protein
MDITGGLTPKEYRMAWNDGYSAALANVKEHLGLEDEDLGDLWDELAKVDTE